MLSTITKMAVWVVGFIFGGIFLIGCTSELDKNIAACEEAFPIYAEEMNAKRPFTQNNP